MREWLCSRKTIHVVGHLDLALVPQFADDWGRRPKGLGHTLFFRHDASLVSHVGLSLETKTHPRSCCPDSEPGLMLASSVPRDGVRRDHEVLTTTPTD